MEKDIYYLTIAEAVSKRSHCLSRKIGAILVRDDLILSAGVNGPPRGIPHCDSEDTFYRVYDGEIIEENRLYGDCPRKLAGYKSGEGLEFCPAVHAERNAILTAAYNGITTKGSTLYCFCGFPCAECFKEIVNAGIVRVVGIDTGFYDTMSEWMFEKSNIEFVGYSLEEISEWLERN